MIIFLGVSYTLVDLKVQSINSVLANNRYKIILFMCQFMPLHYVNLFLDLGYSGYSGHFNPADMSLSAIYIYVTSLLSCLYCDNVYFYDNEFLRPLLLVKS